MSQKTSSRKATAALKGIEMFEQVLALDDSACLAKDAGQWEVLLYWRYDEAQQTARGQTMNEALRAALRWLVAHPRDVWEREQEHAMEHAMEDCMREQEQAMTIPCAGETR